MVIINMIMFFVDDGETFNLLVHINPYGKVVLASGYSLDEKAKDILARGVKAFMQKPYRVDELSRYIRTFLNGERQAGMVK